MKFEAAYEEFTKLSEELKSMGMVASTPCKDVLIFKSSASVASKGEKDIDLLLLGLIHGNEVVGISIINEVLKRIVAGIIRPRTTLAIAVGNSKAGLANERFTETDLNRAFGGTADSTHEDKRARELEPLLRRSCFILDIHQTIESTDSPFFIFGFDEASYKIAKHLDSKMPIISYSIEERRSNGLVATSYSILNGSVAVTAELGQKGFDSAQTRHGLLLFEKYLSLVETAPNKQSEMSTLQKAPLNPKEEVLMFAHRVPNEGRDSELLPGLTNFAPVSRGQLLGKNGGKRIVSPIEGKALFPKYGKAREGSKELCVLLESIPVTEFVKRIASR